MRRSLQRHIVRHARLALITRDLRGAMSRWPPPRRIRCALRIGGEMIPWHNREAKLLNLSTAADAPLPKEIREDAVRGTGAPPYQNKCARRRSSPKSARAKMAGRSVVPSIADSSQQMSPPNGPRGTYLKRRRAAVAAACVNELGSFRRSPSRAQTLVTFRCATTGVVVSGSCECLSLPRCASSDLAHGQRHGQSLLRFERRTLPNSRPRIELLPARLSGPITPLSWP